MNVSSRPFKVALILSAVLGGIALIHYVHHTRIESFDYVWEPDGRDSPAQEAPDIDVNGNPKVVLVRSVGNLQCYATYYDRELAQIVEQHPTRPVRVTYRVRVRFGHVYWIETLETAGMPNIMGLLQQRGRGDCF